MAKGAGCVVITAEEKLVGLKEETPEVLANVIPPVIPGSQPVAHQ